MNTTGRSFREQCRQLAIRDRHLELLELMQKAPVDTIEADEDLAFWYALSLISTASYAKGAPIAEEFCRRFCTPDNRLSLGRCQLLQSVLHILEGDTKASYNLMQQVVAALPQTAYHEHLRAWSTIDTMAGHIGDTVRMHQAIEALADVRNHLPFDQSWWYSFVVPNRADILAKRGHLEEAEMLLLAQLSSVPQQDIDIIKLRLAIIALEHQDPTGAEIWLNDMSMDGSRSYWGTEALIMRAQIKKLLGDPLAAQEMLEDGLSEQSENLVRSDFYRVQLQLCELWIQEGKTELADTWIGLASTALDPWPRTFGHPISGLIRAQLEMAKEHWSEAIRLLETLREDGMRRGHDGLLVGIYAHLAYAHAAVGNSETSLSFVKHATDKSANGNFARSLTVFGVDVRHFLTRTPQAVVEHSKFQGPKATRSLLSKRELEVLRLVEAGLRNAEIASNLFVSQSTIKNHLMNIYKLLGVNKRRDAVFAAQSMGLLSGKPTGSTPKDDLDG